MSVEGDPFVIKTIAASAARAVYLEPTNASMLAKVGKKTLIKSSTDMCVQLAQVLLMQRELDLEQSAPLQDIEAIFRSCIQLEGWFALYYL